MISKGVMEINSGMYRVGCACGDSSCDLMLMVDDESISIYSELSWNDYDYVDNIFLEKVLQIWNRIKTAIRILVLGRFKLSSELIIIDEEHTKNIIRALLKNGELNDIL